MSALLFNFVIRLGVFLAGVCLLLGCIELYASLANDVNPLDFDTWGKWWQRAFIGVVFIWAVYCTASEG